MSHDSDSSAAPATHPLTVINDAVCTVSGCMCDDIRLTVQNNRIVAAENACPRGQAWFLQARGTSTRPECWIHGQPATLTEGYDLAASILCAAKSPLVYGLSESPSEAQRVAVGIADWIGGTVDTPTSSTHVGSLLALQSVGQVTCTLGEIANRADLVLFWGANPAVTQPRHFSRYSLEPKGLFVPRGRADRTCVVIDTERTETAAEADLFIQHRPESHFEALWTLRALAANYELDSQTVESATGVPLRVWQDLMERMKTCRFGAICYGPGVSASPGKHANCEAMHSLAREMNAFTRFVVRGEGGAQNSTGADNVLTWRTGFSNGVNLAPGYPRYNPDEYTAGTMLARREVDAALLVGCESLQTLSPAALAHLQSIPRISLGWENSPLDPAAEVSFTIATLGIHTPGTVYRMDDVPLTLRPAISSSYPSDIEVLTQIESRVKRMKAESRKRKADG